MSPEALAQAVLGAAKDEALVERVANATLIMEGTRGADPEDVVALMTALAAELMPRVVDQGQATAVSPTTLTVGQLRDMLAKVPADLAVHISSEAGYNAGPVGAVYTRDGALVLDIDGLIYAPNGVDIAWSDQKPGGGRGAR